MENGEKLVMRGLILMGISLFVKILGYLSDIAILVCIIVGLKGLGWTYITKAIAVDIFCIGAYLYLRSLIKANHQKILEIVEEGDQE